MTSWLKNLTAEMVKLAGSGDFNGVVKAVEAGGNINVVGKHDG